MEEKIKKIYFDLLRTYSAKYNTLLTKIPFGEGFRNVQGSLYVIEFMIKTFEEEFPSVCHCEYEWKRDWKDEHFI